MGTEGAAALAAAVPNCPRLRRLNVRFSLLDDAAKAKFEAAEREGLEMDLSY